jgi:hypothetical protein
MPKAEHSEASSIFRMGLKGWFFLNLASFSAVCAHPAKELRTSPGNAIRLRSTMHSSVLIGGNQRVEESMGTIKWTSDGYKRSVITDCASSMSLDFKFLDG